MPEPFIAALAGGALIGTAAVGLLYCNGRIAGISNIVGGLLPPEAGEAGWRGAFLSGLLLGGVLLLWLYPQAFSAMPARAPAGMALAGLLVGLGASLGNGCTSGHGICGLARRSPRSMAATAAFMASGAATVYLLRHVWEGVL